MTEYRWATEDDYRNVIEFANHVFDPDHWTFDFEKDTSDESYFPRILPKLYQNIRTAPMHRIAVRDGMIVGCVGNFVLPVKVGQERLYVIGIGTVSTHPEARREGYMKTLMADSMAHAEAVGADYMVLGGQRQRYGHWGFENAGVNTKYLVTSTNLRHIFGQDASFGYTFRKLLPTDSGYIAKERLLRTSALTSTEHERDQEYAILFSMGATPYVILKNTENGETDESFAGTFMYYPEGHGVADLRLTDQHAVLKVMNDLLHTPLTAAEDSPKKRPNYVFADHIADYDRVMTAELARVAETVEIGHCQMIRVLNYERTLRAYFNMAAAYRRLPDGELYAGFEDGEKLRISVSGGIPSVEKTDLPVSFSLSHTDAVNLFFGNAAYVTDFGYDIPAAARVWFPLPFFQYMSDEV